MSTVRTVVSAPGNDYRLRGAKLLVRRFREYISCSTEIMRAVGPPPGDRPALLRGLA